MVRVMVAREMALRSHQPTPCCCGSETNLVMAGFVGCYHLQDSVRIVREGLVLLPGINVFDAWQGALVGRLTMSH